MPRIAQGIAATLVLALLVAPTVSAHGGGDDHELEGHDMDSPHRLCHWLSYELTIVMNCEAIFTKAELLDAAQGLVGSASDLADSVVGTAAQKHTVSQLPDRERSASRAGVSAATCSKGRTAGAGVDVGDETAPVDVGLENPVDNEETAGVDRGAGACRDPSVDLRFVGAVWASESSALARELDELIGRAEAATDDECKLDAGTDTVIGTPLGPIQVWAETDRDRDQPCGLDAGYDHPDPTGPGSQGPPTDPAAAVSVVATRHVGRRPATPGGAVDVVEAGFAAEGGDAPLVREPFRDADTRIAIAAVSGLAALTLVAIRMYRRLSRDDLLDNDLRSRMVAIVGDEPGIHASELARRLDVAVTTVLYHGRMLAEHDLIVTRRSGGEVVFLEPKAARDATEREMICVLRNPSKRRILEALIAEPGSNMAEIARRVDRARNTVKHHVDDLIERGLVVDESETRTRRLAVDEDLRSELADRL